MKKPYLSTVMRPIAYTPVGIFDSGYGGLTILSEIRCLLPAYDYVYLGDNARSPYGSRSFDVVYKFTRQAVSKLFSIGCPLVILACNTASAKALRTMQQRDLPGSADPSRRILGIIRPTAEAVGDMSRSRHVGVLATPGTVSSHSYCLEIGKLAPDIRVTEEACPLWVPLVETGEAESPGADYFVRQHMERLLMRDAGIDTVILGCTHYPLLLPAIHRHTPENVRLVSQGEIVADSLADYLLRHPEIQGRISRGATCRYLTTESKGKFDDRASVFLSEEITAEHIDIDTSEYNQIDIEK